MKKTKKTLIIIDMQPYFYAANHQPTINAIFKLIQDAKETGSSIIIVEYDELPTDDPCDLKTIKSIRDAAFDTGTAVEVRKSQDDGYHEVIAIAKGHGIDLSYCIVCGVNTNACVRETFQSLCAMLPNNKFELALKACNSEYGIGSRTRIAHNKFVLKQVQSDYKNALPYPSKPKRVSSKKKSVKRRSKVLTS